MAARALSLLLLLAGCAAEEGRFPSLAPRPIEKTDVASEPAAQVATGVARDPVVAAKAREALAAAQAGETAFSAALAEAEPRVRAAGSAAAGSDRWVEAQLALSRVQSARVATADAVQELDDQRSAIGDGAADPVLEAARDEAAALAASQDDRFNRLRALLPE